eukprot:CAMPEP_0201566838 /NCGR_PEP_ID=MMETSP0190_2-20130828/6929_1 /ASSEMBLY_ACC=CAM_ASM_000263 /TAXON_ID=37353 /ORGANISM="Rosalina sp." /LENGTH=264 /DNA_ID=CAMNT_0047986093 /DNA_START=75 /DNA_END=866 /DNA_ORIENTATION=+
MSALDEALCWGCQICTFNNPLEAGQCAMCNNPRPQVQYENLLQIREEGRRQRILQEEQDRQMAMNANMHGIKYQSMMNTDTNQEVDEEEQAKKLLEEDDGQDWGDDDFKDDNDDVDWGDDNNDNQESVEMEDNEDGDGDGDDYEYEEDGDEDFEDDDGWGEAKIQDQTIGDVDMKLPEMMKSFEILNPYKLLDFQVKFMKEISEELYIEELDDVGIMCRYYRWNKGQLMDEYLANSEEVFKKCGVISSSKALSKPQETGKFDCW